jgi:uncharacterized protein YdhG (YjbR/CyaY superfamily)
MPTGKTPRNVDEYIAGFPGAVQTLLQKVRATIRRAAPDAVEKISYRIAGYFLDGKQLIYFAGFQRHIGLYPAPRGAEEFRAELAAYAGGKGTVQFPLDKPLPLGLIRRIVLFRAKENLAKAKAKAKVVAKPVKGATNHRKKRTKRATNV